MVEHRPLKHQLQMQEKKHLMIYPHPQQHLKKLLHQQKHNYDRYR
jgi:hypothetical protein